MNFKSNFSKTSININTYNNSNFKNNTLNFKNTYQHIDDYEDIDYSKIPYENPSEQKIEKDKICLIDTNIAPTKNPQKNAWNCYQKYFKTEKFKNYKEFKDYVMPFTYVSKPHRDTSYATQGCCSVGEYTLLTSYDTRCHFENNKSYVTEAAENSRLDIVDKNGRTKTLYFDHDGHVGGVSYHQEKNKIYIPGKGGKINIYDIEDISKLNDGDEVKTNNSIKLKQDEVGIKTASYLTVHENHLYVGEWVENKKGSFIKYELDENGIPTNPSAPIKPPINNVQGMCVYEYNGKEYFFFSGSLGRTNDSTLYIGLLNEDGTWQKINEITMPCMSEQISIDENGNMMVVFESDCCKYGDAADGKTNKDGTPNKSSIQTGNVIFMNTEAMITGDRNCNDLFKTMAMERCFENFANS